MCSYLLSLQVGACRALSINNYLTRLFHDLPEVLTRDIVSPVKGAVEGLADLIKEIEREWMRREVYDLLPKEWHSQIRFFTENEFTDVIVIGKKHKRVPCEELLDRYNRDEYNPRCGSLVKVADELAAYVEARQGIKNGSASQELRDAGSNLFDKYQHQSIGNIALHELFSELK